MMCIKNGAAEKQQIPTIYGFDTFRDWMHIVELLIFATAPSPA